MIKPTTARQYAVDGEAMGGTILVVGDDPDLKNNISRIISQYRLIDAAGSDEALRKAEEFQPDLVICDLTTDKKKCFHCLESIKTNHKVNHIPVMVLTENGSADARIEGLEAGADDYIPKPFNEKELRIKVKNLVKLRMQEDRLKRLNRQLQNKISEQLEIIMKNERLTRFFPRKLVKWILADERDVELTSEKKRLTVFFSDLQGFTEFAEATPPERVTGLLNDYFTEMVKIVDRYEGTLDKFIGDGLMVFFGAPDAMDDREQAVRAVTMAVAMQQRMAELREKWKNEGIIKTIRIRMGIHQDMVMVGNFGSRQLMEYTVFGSGVNLANRLESYCEPSNILVSYPIYAHARDVFPFKGVVEQLFRGFERLIPVSELDPRQVKSLPEFV